MLKQYIYMHLPEKAQRLLICLMDKRNVAILQRDCEELDSKIKVIKEEHRYLYVQIGKLYYCGRKNESLFETCLDYSRFKNISKSHLENYFGLFGTLTWHFVRKIYPVHTIVHEKEGAIIDCGAHFGIFTVLAAKEMQRKGSKGKVLAIEIDRGNYQALLKNIKLNKLKNVIAIQKGVFSKKAEMNLFMNRRGSQTNSIIYEYVYNKSGDYKVSMDRLDNILKEQAISRVQTIKIDVEGAEVDALEGMRNTLSTNPKTKIFLATHAVNGVDLKPACVKKLGTLGFSNITKTDYPEINIFMKGKAQKKRISAYRHKHG